MPADTQTLLRHLRRLTAPAAPPSDACLLDRFVRSRDEAAFAALVGRHGPMVWGVCRRVLADAHAAEDAFQATFLVLARKAATVRPPEALAGWLYGVSRRVALKARSRRTLAPLPEGAPATASRPDPLDELTARELLGILDDEVGRLPRAYRLPILLCCLEGVGQEEAARRLGWTPGALRGRLGRGRKLLQARLARRGLELPAALAVVEVARGASAVPPALAAAAVRTALSARAAGRLLGWKLAVLLPLLCGVAALGAGLATPPPSPGESSAGPSRVAQEPSQQPAPAATDSAGDPLPAGALARLGTLRYRLGNHLYAMALAPDGKTAVTVGGNAQTHFWDVATGKPLRAIDHKQGGGGRVVAYAPDGRTVATVQDHGLLHLWDAATGKHLAELGLNMTATLCVAFAPDSRSLAVGGFSAKYGQQPETSSQSIVSLWRWDGTRLKPRWEVKPDFEAPLGPRSQGIGALAFSPDGKHLATGGSANNLIRIWNISDGKEVHKFRAPGTHLGALAFAPAGKALASGSDDGTLALWDPATGTKAWQSKQPGEVRALAFAPGGKTLAAGGGPEYGWRKGRPNEPFLALVDARDGTEVRRLRTGRDSVASVAYSKDGATLAAGLGGTVRVWDGTTGKERPTASGHANSVSAVAVSEDGQVAATAGGDGAILLWDVARGMPRRRLTGHLGGVRAVGFVPGGQLLASAGTDQTVRVWDLARGEQKACLDGSPQGTIYSMAVSPDGTTLAAGDYSDGSVSVWNLATGERLHTLDIGKQLGHGVLCLAFSPDGKVLAAGETVLNARRGFPGPKDSRILCWNPTTGGKLAEFAAHEYAVNSLVFAPDSHTLASTGWGDKTVRLWDAASGARLFEWPCRSGHGVVTYSPDGKTLAWGGSDGILLWETASKQLRREFPGHPSFIHSLAFTPDGRALLSGSMDTTALVWDVAGLGNAGAAPPALSEERLRSHWGDLASPDAEKAGRALWALAADPPRSVPFLEARLRDRPAADQPRIPRLVADLDSANFQTREAAEKQLQALGKLAEPALRAALAGSVSLETRRRVEKILLRREAPIQAPEVLRAIRAIEALERIGSPEAGRSLEAIARQPLEPYLRYEAKTAAGRIGKRGPLSP